jgi:hypothetical protein
MPLPPEDVDGVRSSACGLRICPPSELMAAPPDANSDMLALPRRTAPAAVSFATRKASSGGVEPSSISDPAVVGRSAVSKLSLTTTGMPCSGERRPLRRRSASRARAVSSAFGMTTINPRNWGPLRS